MISKIIKKNNSNLEIALGSDCDFPAIDQKCVQSAFSKVSLKTAAGPDGLSAFVLKNCSEELSKAWFPIFQSSALCCVVPQFWKRSTIVPIAKTAAPASNKDYRPVALTSLVMKCFEKIMVGRLKAEVSQSLDPLQFAYRQGLSTTDAIVSLSHFVSKHLENAHGYARVLFADFTSAFDTVCPHLLAKKLNDLNISPSLIKWFLSFLTERSQQVRLNGSLSAVKTSSTGVPQGAVSSPILFTLYTNDCRSTHQNNKIMKFSDDTIILSLLTVDTCPSVYFKEVASFHSWCEDNHLILNPVKTKELIFDPKHLTRLSLVTA